MNNNNNTDFFCNNCGKQGHSFHQCKMPITSNGVIAYRIIPHTNEIQYLMICRKDTLGYIDFMRGKFPVFQKQYIMNMLLQMTIDERNRLRQRTIQNQKNGDDTKDKIQLLINGITVTKDSKYDMLSLLDEADTLAVNTARIKIKITFFIV
jgi:hypothetical protein